MRSGSTLRISAFQFGTFVLDAAAGELYKAGIKIRLQDQSLHLLAAMLDRPGEIITREDLRKQLWPDDTFVDFEHSLNAAVKRLRDTLGDSAEQPRFIETVHRRGYRFLAPVVTSVRGLPPGSLTEKTAAPAGTSLPKRSLSSRMLFFTVWVGTCTVLAGVLLLRLLLPSPPPKVLGITQLTDDGQEKYGPMATDGARLYYNVMTKTGMAIGQVSVQGGETSILPTPPRDSEFRNLSPDGTKILFLPESYSSADVVDSPVYEMLLPAGAPHRVGDLQAHDVSWAPDGKHIVYARGKDLFVVQPDGSESRKLITLQGYAGWIRWSSDGRVLRFTLSEPTKYSDSLWEVAADGTHLRSLFSGKSDSISRCCGSWTPDGKYFIFHSGPGDIWDLWAVRDGNSLFGKAARSPTQLTTGPMHVSGGGVLSRDGKKVFLLEEAPRTEIVRFDGKLTQFSPYLPGVSATFLDFSRDGNWVAYVSYPDGAVWRSRVDGSERLQLTPPGMEARWPKWSPDGRQIAFSARNPGEKFFHIHLQAAAGDPGRQITAGDGDENPSSWAPDGSALAFGNSPDADGNVKGIHLLDLRTQKITILPDTSRIWFPVWSPDGARLAALSTDKLQLLLYDFKTRRWTMLGDMPVGRPFWSLDGKYVCFDSTFQGESAFYRLRIADKKIERKAGLGGLKREVMGGTLSWLGFAPDGSLLAVRDISHGEIYSLDLQLP